MENYVARANVDHFLEMLKKDDLPAHNRSSIIKLMIDEETKLGHDREQLEFAEMRAAACRDHADRQRRLVNSLDPSTSDWAQAKRLLVNFESLAQIVEFFCKQMRSRVDRSRL